MFDDIPSGEKPTFHEIRSLGCNSYLKNGFSSDYVNLLYGHTSIDMTKVYLEGHEPNWTEARADIDL